MRSLQLKCGLCLAFTLWLPLSGAASEAARPSGARTRTRAARTDLDRTPHLGEEHDGLGFHAPTPAHEVWHAASSRPFDDVAALAAACAMPAPPALAETLAASGSVPAPAALPVIARQGRAPPIASL